MSFWWIWGIYFMDHVVLRNDFGMDKKLGAVSGGLGIVRVMAAAWLISVMISAVGMVLASLIFYAVGEDGDLILPEALKIGNYRIEEIKVPVCSDSVGSFAQ